MIANLDTPEWSGFKSQRQTFRFYRLALKKSARAPKPFTQYAGNVGVRGNKPKKARNIVMSEQGREDTDKGRLRLEEACSKMSLNIENNIFTTLKTGHEDSSADSVSDGILLKLIYTVKSIGVFWRRERP